MPAHSSAWHLSAKVRYSVILPWRKTKPSANRASSQSLLSFRRTRAHDPWIEVPDHRLHIVAIDCGEEVLECVDFGAHAVIERSTTAIASIEKSSPRGSAITGAERTGGLPGKYSSKSAFSVANAPASAM